MLLRAPTPYPKELRTLARQARRAAARQAGQQGGHAPQPAPDTPPAQAPAPPPATVVVAASVPAVSAAPCVREARVSRPQDPATLSRTNSVLQQEHSLLAAFGLQDDDPAPASNSLQEWLNAGHRYDDVPAATPTPTPSPRTSE